METDKAWEERIESLRTLLHEATINKSFTDPNVIEISQKLNDEINKYLMREKN